MHAMRASGIYSMRSIGRLFAAAVVFFMLMGVRAAVAFVNVYMLAIDPSTPSTLYVATSENNTGGVFRSTNSGGSWIDVSTGLSVGGVTSLAIDPSTPSTLYAGSPNGGGVFKSTNSGSSWSAVNNGLGGNQLVHVLAIDPNTPSTLYAGTAGGAFKSTNSGGSWSAVGTLGSVYALAIDPSTPSTLYAGTAGGVFKSTNSGGTWSNVSTGLSVSGIGILSLAIDPSTPSTLYAGSDKGDGVFKSTNSGGSWSAVNTGLSLAFDIEALAIDPSTPSTLYAGTEGVGVFKSTNSGGSWSAVNTGLPLIPTPTPTLTPSVLASATPSPTTPICALTPVSGCVTPITFHKKLKISPAKNMTMWRWRTDQPGGLGNVFGDPVHVTDYGLCIYANGVLVQQMPVPHAAVGWKQRGSKGFRYAERAGQSAGVTKIVLRTSATELADIVFKARGGNIVLPPLPLAEPVVAQLAQSHMGTLTACWEGDYSSPIKNDAQKGFLGKND